MTTLPSRPQSALPDPIGLPWRNRLGAGGTLIIPSVLLGIATCLHADPRGLGTHQQLGLPACGFYAATGIPCPTCGMTTAFTHAAHGHLIQAAIAQPAGAVLSVACACTVLIALYALLRGLSMAPYFQWLGRFPVVATFAGLVIAAWVFKIFMVVHGIA